MQSSLRPQHSHLTDSISIASLLAAAAALYVPCFLGLEAICREVIMVVRGRGGEGRRVFIDGEILVHVLRSEI